MGLDFSSGYGDDGGEGWERKKGKAKEIDYIRRVRGGHPAARRQKSSTHYPSFLPIFFCLFISFLFSLFHLFFPSFHSMGGSCFFLFHFFFFQNNFFFVSYRSRAPAGWQTTKRPPAKPTQAEPKKKKKKKQKKLWAKCWIEPIVFFLPPLACAVITTSRRPRQNGSVGTAVLLLLADGERWQRIFDFLRATHTH